MYYTRSGYYWIFFNVILFFISYIGYLLGEKLYLWSSYITIIIGLILFVAIIPFAAYLADLLMKFTIDKNIYKKSIFKFFLVGMIVLPIALVSMTIYNEYREKNLSNVLGYDPSHVKSMEFHLEGSSPFWKNNNHEAVLELYNFLSQYHVKKMRDSEWDRDVSKETGFWFTIYTKGDIIRVSVYENRLILYGGRNSDYFSVTNGPIDMEWIANYNDKYD
ncbi:MAG: hypothetical protein H0Z32_03475 [Bacillaceae bacterium]|nr:hypothetical protein [Bacillaceae bacterium]